MNATAMHQTMVHSRQLDQYDMTGRLVQSATLEKNTGAAGDPTEINTHEVQSLEIGYDNYNRGNRLVQSLEGSKTKTGLV